MYDLYQIIQEAELIYCKFLAANDTGETGGHQSGIYIPKDVAKQITDVQIMRGTNDKCPMTIDWGDNLITESVMTYYGIGSRNETRITRFGHGFPYLTKECTGNLFVLAKKEENYYAFMLETDDAIDDFLAYFRISPIETNRIIKCNCIENTLQDAILEAISSLSDFPQSSRMSEIAQQISQLRAGITEFLIKNKPDDVILKWIEVEYLIFNSLENKIYQPVISDGFSTFDAFLELANQVLNRRKSRAGKSLEHHLSKIFDSFELPYSAQPTTEGKKKPDFIFPSEKEYHDKSFPEEKLVFLGAKTTCKDRWRQILNEANRIPQKHLFTLQQGISSNQLQEMSKEGVTLVVPSKYKNTYPTDFQNKILSLEEFICVVKNTVF